MLAALKKAMGAHSLLSVYPSADMDTFYVGYVCEVNERTILMKLITTKGYESGFSVFFTDNIQKVTMDGCYERKIQRLLRNNGISFDALKRMPTTGSPVELTCFRTRGTAKSSFLSEPISARRCCAEGRSF